MRTVQAAESEFNLDPLNIFNTLAGIPNVMKAP